MTQAKSAHSCKPEAWYGICRTSTRYGAPVLKATVSRQGCTINKGFTVSHYGTEEKALEIAQKWRDAVLALLPPMTYTQLRNQPRKNSTSGITGVYRESRKNRGAEWVARIEVSGKSRTATFGVNIHGEEQAKALAIEAREQFLREAGDKFFVVSEVAKANAERNFGTAQGLIETQNAKNGESSVQEIFMQRLRDAGLIGKPPTPLVQRRNFASSKTAIWEVRVPFPDGTQKTRSFSVSMYGEEEAKRLAEETSKQLLAEKDAMQRGDTPILITAGFAEKLAEYPNEVLDVALDILHLKSDAALARVLRVVPPVLSKIRHDTLPLGSTVIVRLLEVTDLHIRDFCQLAMKIRSTGITGSGTKNNSHKESRQL